MDFHQQDRYYLGGFNADLESTSLQKKYTQYQKAWKRASNVGGLPMATCLELAVKYPKIEAKDEVEVEVAVEKRKPGRPPKVTA